mgnify:FL=1
MFSPTQIPKINPTAIENQKSKRNLFISCWILNQKIKF